MNNQNSIVQLHTKLEEYKTKYYLNKVLKGSLIAGAILLGSYLFVNTLEYFGRFGTSVRAFLFYAFISILLFTIIKYIAVPLYFLLSPKKPINDFDAAKQIGDFFPEIKDKLLNTLQLTLQNSNEKNELISASIDQKTKQIGVVKFADAIKINENKKYAKYILIPAGIILAILAIYPHYFAESSSRIVNFKNEYAEPAPFHFNITNNNLRAFKNDDFTINLKVEGKTTPQDVFLIYNDRKIHLDASKNNTFSYIFRNIQEPIRFNFEASGYNSETKIIEVVNRPSMNGLKATLSFPTYLNKQNTIIENSGNFTIPEGTNVKWELGAEDTDSVIFVFDNDKKILASKSFVGSNYTFQKQIRKTTNYEIKLFNEYSANKDASKFNISVIPDNFPTISLEQFKDTTLFNYVVLGGKVADDYGLSALRVHYTIERNAQKPKQGAFSIPIEKSQNIQNFYSSWALDSLKLQPGDKMSYYAIVSDNDGVNGAKSTKSGIMEYKIPNAETIDKNIETAQDKTKDQLEKTINKAEKLKNELAELEKKLKNNTDLNFQDKKLVDEILQKRQDLMAEIKALQEQYKTSTEQQQRFDQQNPEITEKVKQLDNLIKDLLDEETKKMYENLKELLEKKESEKMLDQLEKLKNKDRNLEKELDRAMKLFKKLEKEQKVDKAIKDLIEQADKQEKLADKTDKKDENESNDDLKKQQEGLQKEFEKTQEELKEAEKLSEELKEDEKLDTDKKSQEDIAKDQKQSKEQMDKKDNKKSASSQKKAAQKMKNLAEKLSDMKKEQETIEMEENLDDLRQILDNLVKLSFDQEKLMKDFRNIRVGDPRFVKLGQTQIKLKDDAKVIEDSLNALANRVFQIKSFVTREVGLMNYHMEQSSESIKERKLSTITARQQFAMTSMNNLALLLSDVLNNMQMSMMDMTGKGKGKKKGKTPLPMMSEMQQKLNQKMQGTTGKDGKGGKGKDGKNGREGNSEELAKMAQEQGRIRRMLQDLMDSQKGNEIGKQLGEQVKDLIKKMDQTETDIVNKQITPQTLKRQQEIQTRLLESEKALKQQEEDNTRKAETAGDVPKTIPKALEDYVKNKQKQTELIRTVPANLSPFYKQEVDSYFKRINK